MSKDQLVNSEGKPISEEVVHHVGVRFLKPGESLTIKNPHDTPMAIVGTDVHYVSKETRKSYDLVNTGTLPYPIEEGAFTPYGESEVTVRLSIYASKAAEHRRAPRAQVGTF